jgi:hypothetical protein
VPATRQLVAVVAVLGGILWAVKSAAILVTGWQPPVIFEGAVVCFGLVAVGLPGQVAPGRRRRALRAVGAVALAASVVALVGGEHGEPFLLPAMVCILVVLAGAGDSLGPARASARVLALGTVPLLLVGGLLEVVHERLLEVPLLVTSLLWVWFGVRLAGPDVIRSGRYDDRTV